MPKFILFISLLQVLVHFYKIPKREIILFQFDPLRRHELWRYLSPLLIHPGRGDEDNAYITPHGIHMWMNILGQLFFGTILENTLDWKRTAIIYLSSVLFGSLASSTLRPCRFSVGSSDALCGLILACLAGHTIVRCPYSLMRNPTTWIIGLSIIASPYMLLFLPGYPNFQVDNAAHLGGALGGFLVSVVIWQEWSPLGHHRRGNVLVSKVCCLLVALFLVVTVLQNVLYFYTLSSAPFISDNIRSRLMQQGKYVDFAVDWCEKWNYEY